LTSHLSLDFFALYSSTTSLLGVSGLGHYAAANEFLSSVAAYRRDRGLAGLSVRWGTWDTMRATSADQRESYLQFGLHPMDSGEAHAIFGALLGSPEENSDVTVASIDWSILKPSYEARRRRPLLTLLGTEKAAGPVASVASQSPLLMQLEAARPGARLGLVREMVEREVARVLRLNAAREIDPQRGFFEMGMDSLMAVELKTRLEDATGISLPSSLTFNYPNVGTLAAYLTDRVLQAFALDAATGEPTAPGLAQTAQADVPDSADDDLSEDELADLLTARLARMQ
jgi:myxalamid-type polyketide synthase MxaE and MxaD